MIKHNYKDSIFRLLFGSEEYKTYALELYNAINETEYIDPQSLELTTISNVIFMGIKNDVSFIIDDEMNLWEHQSTHSPNMPLRGLYYFARLFARYTKANNLKLYGSKQMHLPTPVYIVFYNGRQERPEKEILHLSDSFDKPEHAFVEVTAMVLNINYGKNRKIMDQCTALKGYAQLIDKIRKYEKTYDTDNAVDMAISYCIENDILKEFLEAHAAEVKEMYILNYTLEDALKDQGDESYAEGRKQGHIEGEALFAKLVSRLLNDGKTEALQEVSENKEKREEYYRLYGLYNTRTDSK